MSSVLKPILTPPRTQLKILIVEDDDCEAELIEELLIETPIRRLLSWKQVNHLGKALELLNQEKFDVLLLDLSLPDSRDFETVARVKQRGLNIPIVVLTARDDEELALQLIQAGVQDYLIKGKVDSQLLIHSLRYAIERHQNREALRLSEEKYRLVIDNLKEVVFQTDPAGHWIFLNPAWTEITGFSIPESLGTSFLNYVHPDDCQQSQEKFRLLLEGEKGYSRHEVRYLTQSGEVRWLEVRARLTFASDGKISGITGTLNDITEQVLAQLALLQSELRWRSYFENSLVGIAIVAPDTSWIAVNNALCNLLGYSRAEIIQKNLAELTHPDDKQAELEQLALIFAGTSDGYVLDKRFIRKEGQVIYTRLSVRCIRRDDGTIDHLISVILDLSDRYRYEAQLKASEAREREKAQQLEIALHELKATQAQLVQKAKMASLGKLVACVAHEINNPVNFIYGNVNYARKYAIDLLHVIDLYQQCYPKPLGAISDEIEAIDLDFLKQDFPKLLESIGEGANRIHQIVLCLRNFSRLDEAEMKEADLHSGINSTLMILQNRLKEQSNRPAIDVIQAFGGLPKVECYPSQLNQVFMNILSNAIDALDEKIQKDSSFTPKIWICTEISPLRDTVVIRIADNGTGIPSHIKERLFEPFFTTKPVGQGTGLGLSISYQIVVEKHQGTLQCHSQPGNGTEFAIAIPLKPRKLAPTPVAACDATPSRI